MAPEILARYSLVTGHEWHTWSFSRGSTRTTNGVESGNIEHAHLADAPAVNVPDA